MIFSVGNKRLDIAFDKEVERIISEYRTISAEHENAVRAIYKRQESIISDNRQENTYTPEYLSKLLDQALTAENKSFDSKRQPLNSELRRIIAGYKENLLSALNVPEKGGDYALRINNAIKFIELEGAEISDEELSSIIKDFQKDKDVMKRFRRMVDLQTGKEKQINDPRGKTTFPLSFGDLEKYEMFVDTLEELESLAENLFISRMSAAEPERTKDGTRLFVPMVSLGELMAEENAKKTAATCQEMTAALFDAAE